MLLARALVVVAACAAMLAPMPVQALPGKPTKVITIVEENHGTASAYHGMPYLRHLADTYGRADGYRALVHPSLPNYLAMAGGSTYQVRDDKPPSAHPIAGASLFDSASVKTYAEGMTGTCQTTNTGRYVARHNPWTYFTVSRVGCLQRDVPTGTTNSGRLRDDVTRATLPTVGLLVPDLCHDAHDCSLATADAWLKSWVAVLTSGPDWKAGRLAIVVTFDEVEATATGNLLTVVVWPGLPHRRTSVVLSHYSWLRWMNDLTRTAPMRHAAEATSLGRAFGIG